MSGLDKLRKLIREEVALAVRVEFKAMLQEELLPFLQEGRTVVQENQIKKAANAIRPSTSMTNAISSALENKKLAPKETGNPIADLLNETAMSMTSDEYRTAFAGDSTMAPHFDKIGGGFAEPTPAVGTVEQMLSTARPTTDINQVNIDVVPDFTALMGTLKSKGAI